MPLIVADIAAGFAKETTAGLKKSAADRQNIINIAASRAITEGGKLYDTRKLELKRVREALKWARDNGFDEKTSKFLASRPQEEFIGIQNDLKDAELRDQLGKKKSAAEAEIELRRRMAIVGEGPPVGGTITEAQLREFKALPTQQEFDPYKVFGMETPSKETPSFEEGIQTRRALNEDWYKTTAEGIVGKIPADAIDRDQQSSISAQLRNAFSKQFGLPGGEREEALNTAGRVLGLSSGQVKALLQGTETYDEIIPPEGFRRPLRRGDEIALEKQEMELSTAINKHQQSILELNAATNADEFANKTVKQWKRENPDSDTSWLIDHRNKAYPDSMKLEDIITFNNMALKRAQTLELLTRNNPSITNSHILSQEKRFASNAEKFVGTNIEESIYGWKNTQPGSELAQVHRNLTDDMLTIWYESQMLGGLNPLDSKILANGAMNDLGAIRHLNYLINDPSLLDKENFIKSLKDGEQSPQQFSDQLGKNKLSDTPPAMIAAMKKAIISAEDRGINIQAVTGQQIITHWLNQSNVPVGRRESFFDVAKKQTRTTEVGAAGDTLNDVEVETAEQKAAHLAEEKRLAEIKKKQDQAGADPILETQAASVLREGLNVILGNLGNDEWQKIVGAGDQKQIAKTLFPLLRDVQKQLNAPPYNLEISTGQILDPILLSIKDGNTDITRDDIIIKILGSRRSEAGESRQKKAMGKRLGAVVTGYNNLVGDFVQEHLIKINDLDDAVKGTPEQQKNASALIALERDVDNAIASYQNGTMSEQTVIAIIKEAGLFTSKLIQQDIALRKANKAPTYSNSHRFTSHVQSFNELFLNE